MTERYPNVRIQKRGVAILHELGLRPASLPGTHFANAWLSYQGSGRH